MLRASRHFKVNVVGGLAPGMGTNRREILSYILDPTSGKYVYVNGLREIFPQSLQAKSMTDSKGGP